MLTCNADDATAREASISRTDALASSKLMRTGLLNSAIVKVLHYVAHISGVVSDAVTPCSNAVKAHPFDCFGVFTGSTLHFFTVFLE